MRGDIHVAKGVNRHVRVDLSGRNRSVPEKLLHHAHIGPALQQMRRKRVAQGVR